MPSRSHPNKPPSIRLPRWLALTLAALILAYLVFSGQMELGQAVSTFLGGAQAPSTLPILPSSTPENPPAATLPAARSTAAVAPQAGAGFDFYVLALSWSPDYCATNDNPDPQQCSSGRRLGFVLHGLWPQNERGYPEYCSTQPLPQGIEEEFPGLFPSLSLYEHEWEKHGTCTGLDPAGYLELSGQFKKSVHIPPAYNRPEAPLRLTSADFKSAFQDVNPGMDAAALAPFCSGSGRYLKETYVCLTLEGEFRACSQEILRDSARSCGRQDFLLRNVK